MKYIHPTAVIGPNVTIGDAYIGPYCIIGYPAEHRGTFPYPVSDIYRSGRVEICDGAILTGHVTVDAGIGMGGMTFIGASAFLMKHSHVGHDAILYPNVTVACGAKIGGHCVIGDSSNIGLNAVIHQRVIVPAGCMIGAGAVVIKKSQMQPNYKYAGNPVRELGPNFKI